MTDLLLITVIAEWVVMVAMVVVGILLVYECSWRTIERHLKDKGYIHTMNSKFDDDTIIIWDPSKNRYVSLYIKQDDEEEF